jgi:hypothetical protein
LKRHSGRSLLSLQKRLRGPEPVSDCQLAFGVNDLARIADDPQAALGGVIADRNVAALLEAVRDGSPVLLQTLPRRLLSWSPRYGASS